jgi:DNA-directed RNA polymerase subunit K/omega
MSNTMSTSTKAPTKRIIKKTSALVPAPVPTPATLVPALATLEEADEEVSAAEESDEEEPVVVEESDVEEPAVEESDAEESDVAASDAEEDDEDTEADASASDEEPEAEEEGEEGEELTVSTKKTARKSTAAKKGARQVKKKNIDIGMLETDEMLPLDLLNPDSSGEDNDDEDENEENYLQKFDSDLRSDFIVNFHPEAKTHNYEEVKALTRLVRDGNGMIVDPLHKTLPFLTKYEMTRVLGQRAKQLDSGAKPFVKVPLNIMDGYHIAELELEQKKMPFILKRPLPNGGLEYWNISDLEVL